MTRSRVDKMISENHLYSEAIEECSMVVMNLNGLGKLEIHINFNAYGNYFFL